MIRPKIIKNIAEEIPQVNDLANAYEACCARNETVKNELTRLLLHLAPDVEPENDIVGVFWQVDNAVCGLLKESRPTPLALDLALPPAKDDTYKIEWLDSETVRLTPSQ